MEMQDLFVLLTEEKHTIDIFTNGSRPLPDWVMRDHVTLIVDFKLPGSGEYGAFDGDNVKVLSKSRIRQSKHAIKFVCKDENDFLTAMADIDAYRFNEFMQVYFGVVWDVEFTNRDLSALILEHAPFAKLNIQVHNIIWPALERQR